MMRKHKYTIAITILAMLLLLWFAIIFHGERERAFDAAIGQDFNDLQHEFHDYKQSNGKWPSSLDDLEKIEFNIIDLRTDKPYNCLTDKNVYLFLPGESPLKILVMTEVYRTNIWPFGIMQAIVLCANDSMVQGYRYVDPKYVVELTPKEVAELSDEDD